jgi:hypothetical protein
MTSSNLSAQAYEPPRIEQRAEISAPLVGGGSPSLCALFTHQ